MYLESKLPDTGERELTELEPWRKALLDAAELIRTRGHCKRQFENPQGRLCVFGAINLATTGLSWKSSGCEYGEAARKAFREHGGGIKWNDARGRTAAEVIAALQAAARAP